MLQWKRNIFFAMHGGGGWVRKFIIGGVYMACRGVFFAIDENTTRFLENMSRATIVEYIENEIEEVYFDKYREKVAETDKAWDAIQRAFSEGELEFAPTTGIYPANSIVLGGKILYGDKEREGDYIVSLKTPEMVSDIYSFLSALEKEQFRADYLKIDKENYGFEVDEQDFEYTWNWLVGTLDFWKNAANERLFVLFTVDQ
jgi:hypothetical protein